jgi:hypothetical protein
MCQTASNRDPGSAWNRDHEITYRRHRRHEYQRENATMLWDCEPRSFTLQSPDASPRGGTYINYVQGQEARAKLEYERARMTRTLAAELRTLLEKQTQLREAREQVAVLGREIAALPTVAAQDKSRLFGTVNTIDDQLNRVQALIDQARGILSQFQTDISGQNLLFDLVRSAFADTPNMMPPGAKIGVALVALIVIVILYCLWMIARPVRARCAKRRSIFCTGKSAS